MAQRGQFRGDRGGGPPRFSQPQGQHNFDGPPPSAQFRGRGGYPPLENRGGYPPLDNRGGYPPLDNRGGYPPLDNRGGYPPLDNRGGYPPLDNRGGPQRFPHPQQQPGFGGPPPSSQYRGGPSYSEQASGNFRGRGGRPSFEARGGRPQFEARGSRPQFEARGGPPFEARGGPPFETRGSRPPFEARGGPPFETRGSRPQFEARGGPARYPQPPSQYVVDQLSPSSQYQGDNSDTSVSEVSQPEKSPERPSARGDGPSKKTKKKKAALVEGVLTEKMAAMSVKGGIKPPKRPDSGGKAGHSVTIKANCWDISITPKRVLAYFIEADKIFKEKDVEINLPPREKNVLLQLVITTFGPEAIYDGRHNIFCVNPIPGVGEQDTYFTKEVDDPSNRCKIITYRMKQTAIVSTTDVDDYIRNESSTSLSLPQDSIRFLDCLLKNIVKGSFDSLGRSALFYRDPVKIVHDKLFTIHKGFITSVRPQWKVRVNIDMTCKAFFTAGNLADVMYNKYGDAMPQRHKDVAYDLRRIRVETDPFYKDGEKRFARRFTVHGMSSEPAASLLIKDIDMTVQKYFDSHHNIKLKYPELPCAKVNKTRDVYMPMELLNVLPYQMCNAKQSDIASEVIRCAAVKPADRFRELDQFVKQFHTSKHPLVKQFNVKIESQPITLQGRVLPSPTSNFGQLAPGKWNTPTFFKTASGAIRWAIISVPHDRDAQRHQGMLQQELPRQARRFNLQLDQPICQIAQRAQLQNMLEDYKKKGVQLVLLVLYDDFCYSTIKRAGDLFTGIRTQCVRGRTLNKPNVLPNLLLKINGKLGGVNWQILDIMRDGKELLMVFGADVTHPSPTQSKEVRVSVAAIIGSVTPDLMRYAVVVRQQATNVDANCRKIQEIVADMKSSVIELIETYGRNCNGRLPTRLIFYRDGVSEGQFEEVLVKELAAIQQACLSIRPDYQPAITYIVVQKRHHVRFLPSNPRARNVDPGTVVDTVITHPQEFDFYLCSQEGIQGTSKPAHYHVLYDDSDWSSDALQQFTYHLCHAYMRCSRSVSYPAPTYYAHLAAFRARDWLADLEHGDSIMTDSRFNVHESQISGMYYL